MYGNRCASTCCFCLATWKKLMDKNLPRGIPERIRHCQIVPLHGLLRAIDNYYFGGIRHMAGVLKYRTGLTEEDKFYLSMWEAIIDAELAKNGLPFNAKREDNGGTFNDGM